MMLHVSFRVLVLFCFLSASNSFSGHFKGNEGALQIQVFGILENRYVTYIVDIYGTENIKFA